MDRSTWVRAELLAEQDRSQGEPKWRADFAPAPQPRQSWTQDLTRSPCPAPHSRGHGGLGSSEPCMGWVWEEPLLEGCTCHSREMGQVPPRGSDGSFTSSPHASVCIPRCHRACSIPTPIALGAARCFRQMQDPCLQQGTRESETQATEDNPTDLLPPCCCSILGCVPGPSHGLFFAEHCKRSSPCTPWSSLVFSHGSAAADCRSNP